MTKYQHCHPEHQRRISNPDIMKRIYIAILTVAVFLTACEEFQPVFTLKYDNPEPERIYNEADFPEITSIKELAARYNYGSERAVLIPNDVVISGKVITDDRPGNFYKSMYIQDETGGIEIKVGRNGLYNEYKPGQTIYVDCNGLYVGMYGYKEGNDYGAGMIQIGHQDPTGEYETSYLESALIVDSHIFKGEKGSLVVPTEMTASNFPSSTATAANNPLIGTMVTFKGLTYKKEIFTLLYLDSNKNKKEASNRIFLSSGKTWGVTTWAMSKNKMKEYLESGIWDEAYIGSGNTRIAPVSSKKVLVDTDGDGITDKATYPDIEKAAYSVSQYFKTPQGKEVLIRTSGYSKFGDAEIPPAVLSGDIKINVTGVLTMYQGDVQLILNDLHGVTTEDGEPLYDNNWKLL